MRVTDLDRDMTDVIPTSTSIESEFLFRRMEEETFRALPSGHGVRVLDAAAGIGQDARTLAERGAWAVAAEPSRRMTVLARMTDQEKKAARNGSVLRVRAWSEALPFPNSSFEGVFCKGALDHFDDPGTCIAEMARVTHSHGQVVLAVANFGSLGCRIARLQDHLFRGPLIWGRRHYDVPSDHFTRYDTKLLRQHAQRHLELDRCIGVSLFWGVTGWTKALAKLRPGVARFVLQLTDHIVRQLPALADVVVISGRPRLNRLSRG